MEISYRTEDINDDKIVDYYVRNDTDDEIVKKLKIISTPVLLSGSRGVGKSMLMKVASEELHTEFVNSRILPVFVTFATSSLQNENSLEKWMLQKILIFLRKSLKRQGLLNEISFFLKINDTNIDPIIKKLEIFIEGGSDSAHNENLIDADKITFNIDLVKEFVEEVCTTYNIKKIIIFFDEACQSFSPSHQRRFFDLFKDLRCSKIVCKAAVYPGLVSYGNFQISHDAMSINLIRSITSDDYLQTMRDIVKKNFNDYYSKIETNGNLLDCLIFCSTGNPRFLLKTLQMSIDSKGTLHKAEVEKAIKAYYRGIIIQEHIKLSDRYAGHKEFINFGSSFLEKDIVPSIEKNNSIIFGISRDVDLAVKVSCGILEYSGILILDT